MTVRRTWVGPSILAAVFGAVAFVFWPTCSYLLAFGREADPTTHAMLVILVVWVLIWNLRQNLARLPIQPFLPGFIGLIALGFFWLASQLVFTRVLAQFAVLAMVPMAVLTLLGVRWLLAMAFPFSILLFALPIWSPLVPILVKWSAGFAEWGIRASGVPMYRDGAYFVLPTGSWSIADACSGAAFLSTCLLLGVLYAWTIYVSPVKRLLFVAGSAAIGVVGNWIRVYVTMMVAHVSNNRFLRDDHYMFGWWLFAVFLAVFCWLGWRYRDAAQLDAKGLQLGHPESGRDVSFSDAGEVLKLATISVVMLAAMATWPILESNLSARKEITTTGIEILSPQGGWSRVEPPPLEWLPEISNPSEVSLQTFEKGGRRINVFIGLFRNETWESKLVTVSNRLAGGGKSSYSLADRGTAFTELAGNALEAKTGIVLGGGSRILAWHWYWINGVSTSNDIRAKLEQLCIRLQAVRTASAWVAIYTVADDSSGSSSRLLDEFMRDMGGALEGALVQTAKKLE